MSNIGVRLAQSGFIFVLALFVYLLFVLLPAMMIAEKKCLEAGYPNAYVTYDLNMYCSNLDGLVTYRVDKK